MTFNDKIIKIRKEILNSDYNFLNNYKIINEFVEYDIPINKSIKQRLYQLLITYEFNKKLLNFYENKKPFSHPLPSQWIDILEKNKIKVSIFSSILFAIFKMKVFLKAIKVLFLSYYYKEKQINNEFNYIHNFNKNIIKNINHNNNLFSWFEKYFNDGVKFYTHDCRSIEKYNIEKLTIINQNLFGIKNIYIFFKFFFLLIKMTLKGIFFCNSILLLLDEIIKLKIISKKNKNLPNKIFFDHSESIFKPLWTYCLEKKNIKCMVFFYSTNNSPIIFEKDQADNIASLITHGWELMSWKNYLVWNEYQLNYFSKYFNINKNYFEISGPIPLESGIMINKKEKKKLISIFDVTPFKNEYYKNFGLPSCYYNFENLKNFYENLTEIIDKNFYQLIFKIKRITKNTDQNYTKFLKSLESKGFLIYDNASSFDLIKISTKVISLPFSSPAIIAKYYNIDTVYFDPTNKLRFLNDYKIFNHDIQILNKEEIKNWLIKN